MYSPILKQSCRCTCHNPGHCLIPFEARRHKTLRAIFFTVLVDFSRRSDTDIGRSQTAPQILTCSTKYKQSLCLRSRLYYSQCDNKVVGVLLTWQGIIKAVPSQAYPRSLVNSPGVPLSEFHFQHEHTASCGVPHSQAIIYFFDVTQRTKNIHCVTEGGLCSNFED